MKREGTYAVPFEFEELSYERAVTIAADTGKIVGEAGPLLETVIDMLDELGRPDEYFDCIQVAGTNGKTSTTRFTAAILRGEGLRTRRFCAERGCERRCTPLPSSCATRSAWRSMAAW